MIELDIDGWRCAALASGPDDGPLVVAVHGFPDTARSFDRLRAELGAAGFRVVAPYTRGIAPSAPAPDGDYSVPRLADDVAGLVRALGRETAFVVGHDWGAIAGYAAAALHPGVVSRLVAVAVPPPRVFLRALTSRQAVRSSYMAWFQLRGVAEWSLVRREMSGLERIWRWWSPGWEPDPTALEAARRSYAVPGVARNALAYYRALPPTLAARTEARRRILAPVEVETLLVAGTTDRCVGIDVNAGAGVGFSGRIEVLALEGGHFVHLERPDEFARAVLGFLAA